MFFFSEADDASALAIARFLARAGCDVLIGDVRTSSPPHSVGVYTSEYAAKAEVIMKRPHAAGFGIHAYPWWVAPCRQCIVIPRRCACDPDALQEHLIETFRTVSEHFCAPP